MNFKGFERTLWRPDHNTFAPPRTDCVLPLRHLKISQSVIVVNNQPNAQFFMYVYLYSLHVSGSHVPIIRRIIVSMRHLVYVTLCR